VVSGARCSERTNHTSRSINTKDSNMAELKAMMKDLMMQNLEEQWEAKIA
jgi:hypothetical protein